MKGKKNIFSGQYSGNGISFPAGSGLVAFAAATGVMPLDMPESVLVRFKQINH